MFLLWSKPFFGWWDSFCNHHPDITLTKAEPSAHPRVICNTLEIINKYFDLLEETLVENNLLEKPCQILTVVSQAFHLTQQLPK